MLWKRMLNKATGHTKVSDHYELGRTLGKGQFGLVRLGYHKINLAQVAVKTIKKLNMKPIEVFQQRREIEVLKMCQHNNIIEMVDLFENSETYYIVLEYMKGKDLFEYIKRRDYSLREHRVQDLIY